MSPSTARTTVTTTVKELARHDQANPLYTVKAVETMPPSGNSVDSTFRRSDPTSTAQEGGDQSSQIPDSGSTFSLLPDASNLDARSSPATFPRSAQRTPELRIKLEQMTRRLAQRVNEMRPVLAAAKRTKKSIREERIRRQDEIFREKLETIDSTEWGRWRRRTSTTFGYVR